MSPWREDEGDGVCSYHLWSGTVVDAVERSDGWRGSPWVSLRVLYDGGAAGDGPTEQSPWELFEMVYSRGAHGNFVPKEDAVVQMDPGVAEQLLDALSNLMEDVRARAPPLRCGRAGRARRRLVWPVVSTADGAVARPVPPSARSRPWRTWWSPRTSTSRWAARTTAGRSPCRSASRRSWAA